MTPELSAALERTLETRVVASRSVSGGDINQAFRLELADGRRVFVKANPSAPARMFELEAHGLNWLRATRAIAVPRVFGVGRCSETGFLVLEWIEAASAGSDSDEQLGRQLAALHRVPAANFGLECDNYIGRLTQSNQSCADFPEFYASRRLTPQFEMAVNQGLFDQRARARFELLIGRLPRLLGDPHAPAHLHGDLWSGNCLRGRDGRAWFIDPAVYGGHREIDLAMMRLFGGFSERVFRAYAESYPLAAGHLERLKLMQLYPVLVHVNLFGGSYVAQACRILEHYVG